MTSFFFFITIMHQSVGLSHKIPQQYRLFTLIWKTVQKFKGYEPFSKALYVALLSMTNACLTTLKYSNNIQLHFK